MKINLIFTETKQIWYTHDTESKKSFFADDRVNSAMLETGIPFLKEGQESWIKLEDKNFHKAYKEYVDHEGLTHQGFKWSIEKEIIKPGNENIKPTTHLPNLGQDSQDTL